VGRCTVGTKLCGLRESPVRVKIPLDLKDEWGNGEGFTNV